MTEDLAFWVVEPGRGELRPTRVEAPDDGDVLVRTLRSAVSRGTESLVFTGRVPPSEYQRMAAPFQEGTFPGPVKYGYLNVGVVESGPPHLGGRTVFCLYPHQTRYVVPAGAVLPVPDGVPADRAVLAGTVETAVNALWDTPVLVGDRVAVVGGGMVGCAVAHLASRVPGTSVVLADVDPTRRDTAVLLGVDFAEPGELPDGTFDAVFHTSGRPEGLRRCLELVVDEGTVTDLSWYGDGEVGLPLGGRFHAGRLTLRSSQVGHVAPARRDARSPVARLALALELLRDEAFGALVTSRGPLADLPDVLAAIGAGRSPGLCHLIDYEELPCTP